MDRWQCTECSYIYEGEEPPRLCPECEAPALAFDLLDEELEVWDDDWDDDEWEEDDWEEEFEDEFDLDWDE